jgi:hypothetical protein
MREELDSHGLPRKYRHVHHLLYPGLVVRTLMEDRLQNGTRAIRNVSVLPVESDAIYCTRPVPETQRASTSRHYELLIEGAITWGFAPRE